MAESSELVQRRSPTPTTADLRRENLSRLLRLVHERGPLTRAAITKELRVSRGTVGVLLDALVDAGLLVERQPEPNGARGRPSPVVETVPTAATALAVDLAVAGVRIAVVGLGGRILRSQELAHDRRLGPAKSASRIVDELRAWAQRQRRAGTGYQAVGVACWGIVRSDDGFVYAAPNLGWRDVALGRLLADGLAAPRTRAGSLVQHIAVANDADLGAVAEYRRGAGSGARRLLYVHSNVGVGGGILLDGALVGADGPYAGEIGHMTVDPAGLPCRCGAVGCWETEVDERALLRAAGVDLPLEGAALAARVRRVLDDARAGERRASAAIHHVAAALGSGLASLVHIVGPDRVVLGGYLADVVERAPQAIRRPLEDRGFSPEARNVAIVPARFREEAAIVGAAERAFEPLLSDPLRRLPSAPVRW